MHRFITQVLTFCSVQIVILLLLCMHLRSHSLSTYLGAVGDKHRLLSQTESPRILVSGGSNAAFGISAETLAHKMNRPAVNLGLHAALGRDYILGQLENALRAGDIAVVSLEYELFGAPGISDFLWELLLIRPLSVLDLQFVDLRSLLDHGLGFVAHATSTVLAHTLHGRSPVGFYVRGVFNGHGDVTGHARSAPILPLLGSGPMTPPTDAQIDATLDKLRTLIVTAEQRGAAVYIVFPALARTQFGRNAEDIAAIVRRTKARLGHHVIGTVDDVAVDDEHFFDTVYHLAPAHAAMRATWIYDEVQQALVTR